MNREAIAEPKPDETDVPVLATEDGAAIVWNDRVRIIVSPTTSQDEQEVVSG